MNSKVIVAFIFLILISSCASKFDIQKRKYRKGFYVASKTKPVPKKDLVENSLQYELPEKYRVLKPIEPPKRPVDGKVVARQEQNIDSIKTYTTVFSKVAEGQLVTKKCAEFNSTAKNKNLHNRHQKAKRLSDDNGSLSYEAKQILLGIVALIILFGFIAIRNTTITINYLLLSYIATGVLVVASLIILIYLLNEYGSKN